MNHHFYQNYRQLIFFHANSCIVWQYTSFLWYNCYWNATNLCTEKNLQIRKVCTFIVCELRTHYCHTEQVGIHRYFNLSNPKSYLAKINICTSSWWFYLIRKKNLLHRISSLLSNPENIFIFKGKFENRI